MVPREGICGSVYLSFLGKTDVLLYHYYIEEMRLILTSFMINMYVRFGV